MNNGCSCHPTKGVEDAKIVIAELDRLTDIRFKLLHELKEADHALALKDNFIRQIYEFGSPFIHGDRAKEALEVCR